tara:strand:- start:3757 stop:6390 length:2634 start_codon:yes stop_codon:yes gene_type:complete
MASITQRIPNFLGGVSTQPDDKKLPGQVVEAVNVYPDPTLGLTKRPGIKFLDALHNGSGTDYTTPVFDNAKWFYINRDDDEVYVGCIDGTDIHIWNATPDSSGNYVKASVTMQATGGVNPSSYLTTTGDNYYLLTVQDTTILVNKTTTVLPQATPSYSFKRNGTVSISTVEYSSDYKITVDGTTVTYTTRNADNFVNTATNTALNASEILTNLKTLLNAAVSGLTITQGATTLEITKASDFTLDASGGRNGDALHSFQGAVEIASDLPSEALHGRIVEVVNTKVASTPYYAQFVGIGGSGTVGVGYWEETVSPSVSPGLDAATMPHELINTAPNTFIFRQAAYTNRLVGDDSTNSHPSFVNSKISHVFFHNNRLGYLTGENVSMSQSGEFFNFYHITSSASSPADPVDLSCSSIRPAQLFAVLPTARGLVLFSQNQQYMMYSESGNLTPSDSIINGISNYEMDPNIPPVEVGTNSYFISKTPAWSRIFSFTPSGIESPPRILDIGKIVTEYVPSSVTKLVASPQNSFIILYGETEKTIYFYRFFDDGGEQQVMQAWFKWELPGFPLTVNVDDDVLYMVVQAGNKYQMCTLNITSTPQEAIVTSRSGDSINPFMDFYAPAAAVSFSNNQSTIRLPYDDISALEPVILIKGTGTSLDSGFTVTPTKNNDGTYDNFIVNGKDLSGNLANIIVGYKFNYDVTLPKLYFQQTPDGRRLDYAAYLGINRLKFSVGQSSSITFKLKTKGIRGDSFTFTGDGSTTAFALPFTPDDKNDIKITIDDVFTSAFTCSDTGVITFSSAPANAASIVAFEDLWMNRQSTAEADYYLADDVAISDESIFTLPVNQRNNNYTVRVFSDSPFPVSINSMVWEGQYSPRFIRRS